MTAVREQSINAGVEIESGKKDYKEPFEGEKLFRRREGSGIQWR